jgi:hypothetical protein
VDFQAVDVPAGQDVGERVDLLHLRYQ